jgi:hypothetical protein
MSIEPKRVFLGSYEGGTTNVVIPAAALARANAEFDAERAAKARAEQKAALAIMQAARSQGRLKRALRAVFGRRLPR